MKIALEVRKVSKEYFYSHARLKAGNLKNLLLGRYRDCNARKEVLKKISFDLEWGSSIGIIGNNGSGKSTLLKIVGGILSPTDGYVRSYGKVVTLVDLGTGFHPEVSGRENILIASAILGLKRREVENKMEDIVKFAELDDFIDLPVKYYSAGMYLRLGFAIAVFSSPDILLVDEVLAVGDEYFQQKCIEHLERFIYEGKSLLFVSHSLDLVERLADKVLWLDSGEIKMFGEPRKVIDSYRSSAHCRYAKVENRKATATPNEQLRWGNRKAEIVSIKLFSEGKESYTLLVPTDAKVVAKVRSNEKLVDFVFGIAIRNSKGIEVWGSNTHLLSFRPLKFTGEGEVEITLKDLRLVEGRYFVDFAIHSKNGVAYDYWKEAVTFGVVNKERAVGVYVPKNSWRFEGGIEFEVANKSRG